MKGIEKKQAYGRGTALVSWFFMEDVNRESFLTFLHGPAQPTCGHLLGQNAYVLYKLSFCATSFTKTAENCQIHSRKHISAGDGDFLKQKEQTHEQLCNQRNIFFCADPDRLHATFLFEM